MGLVPVTIAPESVDDGAAASAASDIIEIEVLGECRIRVGSNFDDRVLKRVLDVVRRR